MSSTAFTPALPPQGPIPSTPPPAGQAAPALPNTPTPPVPTARPALSREQQREIFQQKMLQKLKVQAQPPKSKGEAAIRNMLDLPAIFLDTLISGAAVIAIAVARKMEWTKASPWLWGLSFIPLGFAFRGVYSAITGRVPAQEGAQRTLQDLGLAPVPTTPASLLPQPPTPTPRTNIQA